MRLNTILAGYKIISIFPEAARSEPFMILLFDMLLFILVKKLKNLLMVIRFENKDKTSSLKILESSGANEK